jgi:hypothetical protein
MSKILIWNRIAAAPISRHGVHLVPMYNGLPQSDVFPTGIIRQGSIEHTCPSAGTRQ